MATTINIFRAFNLLLNTRGNSRLHHDLARQFISIEKDLIYPDFTDKQLLKAEQDRLDLICHKRAILGPWANKDEELAEFTLVDFTHRSNVKLSNKWVEYTADNLSLEIYSNMAI